MRPTTGLESRPRERLGQAGLHLDHVLLPQLRHLADYWLLGVAMRADLLVEVAELRVTVRVLGVLQRLGADLHTEPLTAQDVRDGVRKDRVSLLGQLVGRLAGGLGRPVLLRGRVLPLVRLDQGRQHRP